MRTKRLTRILIGALLFSAISMMGVRLPSSVYAASKDKGPVSYWRFDEGGGASAYDQGWVDTDSDGIKDTGEAWSNNTGTLTPGASGTNTAAGQMWTRQGKIGGALECDGTDDYVSAGNGASLNVTGSATYEAWVKWTGTIGTGGYAIGAKGNDGYYFQIRKDQGTGSKIAVWFCAPVSVWKESNTDVTADIWHHVAFTYDGSNVRFYLDGKEDGAPAVTGTMTGGSGNLLIGNVNATSRYFNGLIDDLRIYNYARTADQIMVDYNAGMSAYVGGGTDPNEGNPPVGYWKLDENTGTTAYDRSGNGMNGTLSGDYSWATGKYGSAIDFVGVNDYVSVTDSTSSVLDITSALTLEAWVYPNAYTDGGGGAGAFIVTKVGSYYFELGTDKRPRVYLYGLTSPGYHSSNSAIPLNTWTHVVATYDGSNIRFYINGMLDKTIADTGTITVNNSSLMIGSYTGGYSFDGKIDEVKVYNYVRTPAQIAYDYNKGKPIAQYKFDEGGGTIAKNDYSSSDAGVAPVGWWRMDEGTGGTTVDVSGNGNAGTLTPGAGGTNTTTANMWDQTGKIGPDCLEFDGTDDYVDCGNGNSLNFTTNDFTLEAWVNMTTGANILLRKGGGYSTSAPGYSIAGGSSANLQISGTTKVIYNANPGGTLTTGEWNHLAYTIDRSGYVKKYINGILTGQADISADAAVSITNSANLYLSNPGQYWNGLIDDVRIYNYARTAEQIYNDYKTTHGTLVGDTKFVDGKIGKALQFDGTGDYVDYGNNSIFGFSGQKTITFWAYPTNYGYYRTIGWSEADQTPNYFFYFRTDDAGAGTIRLYVKNDANTEYSTNTYPYLANNWYFVAGIIDANSQTMSLYVNGTPVHLNKAFSGTFTNSTSQIFSIGAMGPGINPFVGKLDEVRIYNYARTASQVMQDYNAGTAIHLGTASTYAVERDPWGGALPVAHWKLDENTGVLANDASGNGNNGTLTNGPTWTQGKVGSCLNFDGTDDYVGLTLSKTSPITFELWFKANDVTTASALVGWLAGTHTGYGLGIRILGGYLIGMAAENNQTWYDNLRSPTISSGQWYHVALSFDAVRNNTGTGKIYLNGRLVNSYTGTVQWYDPYSFAIGAALGNGLYLKFNGLIDDVRIYNYARTQAQIAWDYNQGKPVGHWRFDEGSGATAYDESDNHNDGTITIGATGTQTTVAAAWTNGATGKFGKCMSFDGTDDYINCGASIPQTNERTYTWWHKVSANGGATFPSPVTYGGYANGFRAIWRDDTNDMLQIQVTTGTDTTPTFSLQSPSVDQVGAWYHYAMTYDGINTGKLYRNGVLVDTKTNGTGVIKTTASPFYIGLGQFYWNGLVDDVRVYNYVRTADQVMQDYNQGMAVKLGE